MNNAIRVFCIAVLVLCLGTGAATASVIVNGTRVVFPTEQGEVTVRLSNPDARPALIEAWIDDGNPNSTPDTAHTPFLITPPLFRMDAHKDQSLRILYVPGATPLPSDRESVFWLNVLEIPPKPTGPEFAGKNYLQFAIRTRIKLFYRPAKLPGDAIKAPDQLTFHVTQGPTATLRVHNPTPYYVTILDLSRSGEKQSILEAPSMVAPFGDLQLKLNVAHAPAIGSAISFGTINDYGATDTHKGVIAQ